jgi:hypothetical protein
MKQNMPCQTGTAHTGKPAHGDTRIKIDIKSGIEAWFDVDDITIHVWGSTWTGREIVTVCKDEDKRVVSTRRSWRLKTPHAFEHSGHHYLVVLGVGFGAASVELYRDGVLIDSDQINTLDIRIDPATGKLDWKHAIKYLAVPMLVGLLVGTGFGYLAGLAFT